MDLESFPTGEKTGCDEGSMGPLSNRPPGPLKMHSHCLSRGRGPGLLQRARRKAKYTSDLKSLEWSGQAMENSYTITKGETSWAYKSHTAHIHASNQTEVERPSLLKAATVMQEDKLRGQLQSVCPTTPQNQKGQVRVRGIPQEKHSGPCFRISLWLKLNCSCKIIFSYYNNLLNTSLK